MQEFSGHRRAAQMVIDLNKANSPTTVENSEFLGKELFVS